MQPAGPEKRIGIITASWLPDQTDPQVQDTAAYKEWLAWMKKYYPSGNIADGLNVAGYVVSQAFVAVLKTCGDNLTRENVMKQAASIHNLRLPMLQVPTLDPGIAISTNPDDYAPIKQKKLARFDGTKWVPFGELISAPSN